MAKPNENSPLAFQEEWLEQLRNSIHTIRGVTDQLLKNDPRPDQGMLLDAIRQEAKALLRLSGIATGQDSTAPTAEVAQPPEPQDLTLDLTEIQEIFKHNEQALLEFFEALLDDLEVVRQDFETAASQRDYKGFKDASHKIKSFLRIFKPTELMAALQEAEALYKEGKMERLPEANRSILEEIGRISTFLEKFSKPKGS